MLSNRFRERWYLYGDDRAHAEQLLQLDIESAATNAEKAWLLKHWPSLGGFDSVFDWLTLKDPSLLNEISGRAAMLRVLQKRKNSNPWLALVPSHLVDHFLLFCEDTYRGNDPVELWLGGGLGDQLECLAQLCDPCMKVWYSRLHLHLPVQSKAALGPFLKKYWPDQAPRWSFISGNPSGENQDRWLSQMGWSCLLAHTGFKPIPQVLHPFSLDRNKPATLVCCWRSKIDRNDIHWAHLRSLSFVQISALYAELMPWARQHNLKIIDITKYSQDERRLLSPYMHSLELAYSKIHTLLDTVGYIRGCRAVVSVDTALIHMASWFGNPSLVIVAPTS